MYTVINANREYIDDIIMYLATKVADKTFCGIVYAFNIIDAFSAGIAFRRQNLTCIDVRF